jgi:ABC-2 type transport system permease protein
MRNTFVILKRELGGYFTTPVAYVFIFVFLSLIGFLTFQLGGFYEREQADLQSFFDFHPWVYLFLVPAVSMRLWAEERRQGTIELLFTLPITLGESVIGKFLAAWLFLGLALVLTFPMWITVNYLGDPDNGVIMAGYLGSFLMAGGYLAIGACISAVTKNQVIAFVISVVVSLLFVLAGYPMVQDMLRDILPSATPESFFDTVRAFGFLTHFQSITTGVLDLRDLTFFATLIGCALLMNAIVLDMKKAS